MQSLNGHFTKVLFNAEVSQLIVGNVLISVNIISEHVSGDVFELVWILLEEGDEGFMNFVFVEC